MNAAAPEFAPVQEEIDQVAEERRKQREAETGAGAVGGVMPPFAPNATVTVLHGELPAGSTDLGAQSKPRLGDRVTVFFLDADGTFQRLWAWVVSMFRWLWRLAVGTDARAVGFIRTMPRTSMVLMILAGGWIAAVWLRPAPEVIVIKEPVKPPGLFERILGNLPKTREP